MEVFRADTVSSFRAWFRDKRRDRVGQIKRCARLLPKTPNDYGALFSFRRCGVNEDRRQMNTAQAVASNRTIESHQVAFLWQSDFLTKLSCQRRTDMFDVSARVTAKTRRIFTGHRHFSHRSTEDVSRAQSAPWFQTAEHTHFTIFSSAIVHTVRGLYTRNARMMAKTLSLSNCTHKLLVCLQVRNSFQTRVG